MASIEQIQFLQAADRLGALVVEALRVQYRLQGHKLTGRLQKSIEYEVEPSKDGATVRVFMEDYGIVLDQGVRPARIPFSSRSGRGGKSQYIQGLKGFAKKRFGVGEKEATRIAFAIAAKHKKEGMPTRASRRFSRTGKRTGAISAALLDTQKEQERIVETALQTTIELYFDQIIRTAA